MQTSNRTEVDLSKVQHATPFYRNQFGDERSVLPKGPTSRNILFNPDERVFPSIDEFPNETMLERAKRLKVLDIWKPVINLQLSANHNLSYTGKKAVALGKAWKAKIFGKKKHNEK